MKPALFLPNKWDLLKNFVGWTLPEIFIVRYNCWRRSKMESQPLLLAMIKIYRPLFFILFCLQFACADSKVAVAMHFARKDGGVTPAINAELALTPGEQQLGLMYRRKLGEDEGMLFVFPGEQERSFWMKNTYVELDMIFLDSNFSVVSFIERAVPLSETPRRSQKPARYVLEVPGGSVARWGLTAGDTLVLHSKLP
jgi:uncharacterized membrane protein (UPF0127 family)